MRRVGMSGKRVINRAATRYLAGCVLACGILATEPAFAQQILWEADGSSLLQASQGPTQKFIFQSPRGDFAAHGATAGAYKPMP